MIAIKPDAASGEADLHLECDVAASGWLSVRASDIPGLRSQVAAAYSDTLSTGVLKHADEQGLVALLALRQTLDAARLSPDAVERWGLIASARSPGRKRIAESLAKFREHGAWTTSPHLIPHCSLHSQSGLLSQALRLHGPNFGTGGMPHSEGEAFWAAISMLHGDRLPGVWIVLTGWERETLAAEDISCQAVAIGLQRSSCQLAPTNLKIVVRSSADNQTPLTLESLAEAYRLHSTRCWDLGGATCVFSFIDAPLEAAA